MSDGPTFSAMQAVFTDARVCDLTRYVARQLCERPDLAAMSFEDGWNRILVGYAALAINVTQHEQHGGLHESEPRPDWSGLT